MGFLEDGEPEMSPRTIERKKQELLDRKRAREEAAEQEEVERLIPVQWVTSDRDLEQWAPPPGLDEIICEECETNVATLVCEADDEVLCSRCCGLLYPRASTGALHPFFAGFKVRVVQEGDKSGTNVVVRPPLSAEELDEEQWEALGRDLSRPHALEAPKKNFLHATSKSNRPVPKYVEGDVVVFDVEDFLPSEAAPAAKLPPWRNREIWGRVMGTAHPRHGQYGHAVRDGDEHEPHYRVACERWVKVGPPGEWARGGPVDVTPSGLQLEVPRDLNDLNWDADPYRGSGKVHVYETEMAAQAAVDKERAELEAHKEKAIKGMGDGVAPFVLERHLAWVRDRQIKECLDTRKFADPEIDLGYQADATLFPTIVLVPESLLFAPAEARAALVRRRAAQCSVVLLVVDDWLYESRTVRSFLTWVTAVHAMVEEDRHRAAARIQQFVRDKKEAAIYQIMVAAASQKEWEEKRKLHNQFRYLETEEERANGFTTDGKHYFATLYECEQYTALWQEMGHRVMNYILRQFKRDTETAWRRWHAFIAYQMRLESVPVTHYEEFFDVDALLRTTEVALEEEREAHAAAVAAGSAAPWHSAVGMMIEGAGAAEGGANAASAALPPLPRMWAWRDSVGKKVVEQAQKHNSYMATMAGPTDTARWVIPGRVMAGAYPEGKARRRGRQPTPSSTVGQAMIHGIGTFVILMTERETQELEQMHGFPPLVEALRKEHGAISGMLTATVVKQKTIALLAGKEVKRCRQYPKNDLRHAAAKAQRRELVAKERMAFGTMEKAKYALAKFPEAVEVLHFPIPDGGVPDRAELVKLLEAIELRLRRRRGVYLQSRLGHGRASLVGACLLGRLYGIRVHEAVERIQSAHDAQVSVRNSGKVFSAPQTVQQVALVRDILAVNETTYGPAIHRFGAPTIPSSEVQNAAAEAAAEKAKAGGGKPHPLPVHVTGGVLIYPKTRGGGLPLALPPIQQRTAAHAGRGVELGGASDAADAGANDAQKLLDGDGEDDEQSLASAMLEFRPPDFDAGAEADYATLKHRNEQTLPALPCPVKATIRSLRPSSVQQEEAEGNFITRKLRPPEVGSP